MTNRITKKISALAAAFMLAAAPAPAIAQATPAQQTAQQTMTPDKVRADIRAMKDMSYSDLGDAVWKLQQSIMDDEDLTRAAIESLPQFLIDTKHEWKWNHAHLMLQGFMQSHPGAYDADIDNAFAPFLTKYARETIGVKDPALENRLYNISILSKTPKLQDMQVESLAALLPQGDFMTWVHVLRAYDMINENRAGKHESTINTLLGLSLKSFAARLPDDKHRYGASYLIGAMGVITPTLAMPAVDALLPYARDPNPQVQKTVIQSLYSIGNKHPATTPTTFDALAQLALEIDKPAIHPESQYHIIFGVYYLAKGDTNRAEQALSLLQQVALKLPHSDAVRHIADLGNDHAAIRAQAVDTLRDCMAFDINAEDAASGLIRIAENDPQYAAVAADSMNVYLLSHPASYDMVFNLARLADHHAALAPTILKTFQSMADQESQLLNDAYTRDHIRRIAVTHKNTLPAVTAIFERLAATFTKQKNWEQLGQTAEQLGQLQRMTEKYNQSLQKTPGNPAPSP